MPKKTGTTTTCDVLIVGAGPTGLTLALDLARYGVNFRIIDRKKSISNVPQGILLQPSCLEILYDLGVDSEIIKEGKPLRSILGMVEKKRNFELNYKMVSRSLFPYLLVIEQYKLEEILSRTLETKDYQVEWGMALQTFKQTTAGITATVIKEGRQEEIQTQYIIGCDGAESTVRSGINQSLAGVNEIDKFIIADVSLEWKSPPNAGYFFLHGHGVMLVIPYAEAGMWRLIIHTVGKITDDPQIDELQALFNIYSPIEGVIKAVKWSTLYRRRRGIVSSMQDKRAFLVGDAAHIHSPLGGQALSEAIQDAYNLSWKLGYCLQGRANEKVLNSYNEERLEVAKNTMRSTNLASHVLMTPSTPLRKIRNVIAPIFLNFPVAQAHFHRLIVDENLNYRRSSLTHQESETSLRYAHQLKEAVLGGVNIGDQAPPISLLNPQDYKRVQFLDIIKGVNHTLLVFLGDDPKILQDNYQKYEALVQQFNGFAKGAFIIGEHAIDYNSFNAKLPDIYLDPDGRGHKIYRCWAPTLYLLRPDGFVAYKSSLEEEQLMAYINQHFINPFKGQNLEKIKKIKIN